MDARLLGKWGEQTVANDLRRRGWKVIACNYRCRVGEIDLVVQNIRYLVFVEVKLRRNDRFGQAAEAVTGEKQRKLRAAADLFLQEYPTRLQPRFDVAEVYAPDGYHTVNPEIRYIENAF